MLTHSCRSWNYISASQTAGMLGVFAEANGRNYAKSHNMRLKSRPSGSCSILGDLSKPLSYFCFPGSKIKPVFHSLAERVHVWAIPRGVQWDKSIEGQCSAIAIANTGWLTWCFLFSIIIRNNPWEDFSFTKKRNKIDYGQLGTKIICSHVVCVFKGT